MENGHLLLSFALKGIFCSRGMETVQYIATEHYLRLIKEQERQITTELQESCVYSSNFSLLLSVVSLDFEFYFKFPHATIEFIWMLGLSTELITKCKLATAKRFECSILFRVANLPYQLG